MITPGSVIAREMDFEIMHPIHAGMHHELHVKGGSIAGLKHHRTDGRCGRSAPLHNFDVGGFIEAQDLVTHIHQRELHLDRLA